jgi:hypothetical protein
MRLVEIATHPQGYRTHVGAVLKRYAPEKNEATPTWYHISDHNFNLDISHSYGLGIRSSCRHSDSAFKLINTVV